MEEKKRIQKTKGTVDFWYFYSKLKINQGWEYHSKGYVTEHYITKGDSKITYYQVTRLCRSYFYNISNFIIGGKKFRLDLGLGYIKIIKLIEGVVRYYVHTPYKNKDKVSLDLPRVKIIWVKNDSVAKEQREKYPFENITKFVFKPARSDSRKGRSLGFKNRVSAVIKKNPSIMNVYDSYHYANEHEDNLNKLMLRDAI